MSSRHEITGTFSRVLPKCQWENDDGTVTIIGLIEPSESSDRLIRGEADENGYVKIKGTILAGDLSPGITYRFYGQFREHHRYGNQFCFDAFTIEQPVEEDAVIAYLTQCDGIGPRTAHFIWQTFKENSIQMLRESPDEVAAMVPRLTPEKAGTAAKFLQKSEKTERTKMSLLGLLKGRGFPKKIVEFLIRDLGPAASSVIARNPYLLMRYKGCGFLKTDNMYLDMGLNPSRLKRQALCAWHSVAKQSGGDTWIPFYTVRNAMQQQLLSAKIDVEAAMRLACRAKMLTEKFDRGQRWVAEYSKARDEQQIAELIEEARLEFENGIAPLLWRNVASALGSVTDHQRENAELAMGGFIGCLAGRPGTGKTYTVARIVQVLRDRFGLDHVAIAAPTGKAAVRVTAAMQAVGLDLRATTLHSLLGFTGDGFTFNRFKTLPYKFIIVDEASMIDVWMMRSLLDARAEGAHVLFVGDPNQLAPVGHGAPLRDFLVANVPHGELREIQRNSGRIVKACGEIIDRGRFTCSANVDYASGENLLLVEKDGPEAQIDALVSILQKQQRDAMSGNSGIDPVWDMQVIVAVNAKSPLGRKPLNKRMQELLNPDGPGVPGNPFRVGDKIINTKNASYKAIVDPGRIVPAAKPVSISDIDFSDIQLGEFSTDRDDDPPEALTHYVANGEQAEVLSVNVTKIIARLTAPDRTIEIPRSAKADNDDRPSADDSSESEESTGSGCAWELGYAISGHKSQGSEWPVVIVMLDEHQGAQRVESKQWIYTAISRAKKLGLLIGRQSAANAMCGRDALFSRKTFLREQIEGLRTESAQRVAGEAWVELAELAMEGVPC